MAIKIFKLVLKDDGACEILVEGRKVQIEHYNHYGNACVVLQQWCEKFVAECRMERNIKVKKELDDAQTGT